MKYELPIYSEQVSRWISKIDLSGKRYSLYFSWNTRCNFWELSVCDENDNLLCGGIRLVTLLPDLLSTCKNYISGLPEGKLYLVPRNDKVKEITINNLASDYALIYEE